MGDLRLIVIVEKTGHPLGKISAAVEQAIESHLLRHAAVIKVQRNAPPTRQVAPIRVAGVNGVGVHGLPFGAVHRRADCRLLTANCQLLTEYRADGFCLSGGEYGKLYAVRGQHFQGLGVYRRFGEPDAFRVTPKSVLEIADAPPDLGHFVAVIAKRQYQMAVRLCECGAVAAITVGAAFVGFLQQIIRFRVIFF